MFCVLTDVFALIFIFQILLLIFGVRKKKVFYFLVYFATILAVLTSIPNIERYYQKYLSYTLPECLLLLALFCLIILVNLILIIPGIIFCVKKRASLKENIKSTKFKFVFFKNIFSVCTYMGNNIWMS